MLLLYYACAYIVYLFQIACFLYLDSIVTFCTEENFFFFIIDILNFDSLQV